MTHREITELLPWYAGGTLGDEQRAAVEAELGHSPECREELRDVKDLAAAMERVDAQALPLPSFERIVARLPARAVSVRRAGFGTWLGQLDAWRRIALAAAPLAAVAILLFAARQAYRPPSPSVAVPVSGNPVAALVRDDEKIAPSPAAGEPAAQAVDRITIEGPPRLQPVQLVRNGSLNVLVPDVEKSVAAVTRIAQSQNGDVVELEDAAPGTGSHQFARMNVSVPASRFDRTLDQLSKVGTVRNRSISTQNVSDQIVDAQARLRNLRHEESDLVRIMDRSGRIQDVLDVEQQLSATRQAIEQLDAQLRSTQSQVAFSTIAITLAAEGTTVVAERSPFADLRYTWYSATRAAWGLLRTILAAGLWIAAFAPYLVAGGLIGFFLYRRYRRD